MDLKFTNQIFIEEEIKKVKDGKLIEFLQDAKTRFPDYFWTAAASKEKYHPPDERKKGGLVLHVRRLCALTEHMVRLYELNYWERDVLLAASILHDAFSKGESDKKKTSYSQPLHPLYVPLQFPYNADADRFIDKKLYDEIMECVVSHSGRFSIHPLLNSNKKLPSIFQQMDYLASRENIFIDIEKAGK